MGEGLFFRYADGKEICVKEVKDLKGDGLLVIILERVLREDDLLKVQQRIENRIGNGTRVLVLNADVKKVMRLEK